MGRRARTKQDKLGEKLRQIREELDLSQSELLKRLALDDDYQRTIVSSWESGDRERLRQLHRELFQVAARSQETVLQGLERARIVVGFLSRQ